MNKSRVRVGRPFFAWCLSLLLLACAVWICGDTVLGPAWRVYMAGEAAARLGRPAVQNAAQNAAQDVRISVTVPDLTAQPFSVDALDGTLFGLSVTYAENDAPPRTVLAQSPAPGSQRKVVPGQRRVPISVTVSTGPRTAVVPEVYGTEGRQAESALRKCGFVVTVVPLLANSDTLRYVPRGTFAVATPGTAVYTEPAAGRTLTAGTAVTLYVASETPTDSPVCPDVVGMTLSEAKRALFEAGIQVGTIYEESAVSVPGTVTAQGRLAGTRLSPDDSVDLTVAKKSALPGHFWDNWPLMKQKG